MFNNIFEKYRAASKKEAQEKEGNAFTAALKAAREKGDSHFVVSGKRYKCEDFVEKTECPKCEGKGCDHCDNKGYHESVKESAVNEAMDPVKDKEAKKKFDDRDDKDIDNDGDVDSSDKFLHKRRKAIAKSKKADEPKGGEDTAVMNPKKEDKVSKEEVSVRDKLMSIWEKAGDHTKGATKPEEMDSKDSPSAKKMKADHKAEVNDTDEKGHDDASKAGRTGPKAKARSSGDNTASGDRNIVNKIAAAYKGMKNGS